jgi:undecaprenyl-diphosphatase
MDEAILSGVAEWRTPLLTRALIDITALGSMTVVTLLTITAVTMLLLSARNRRDAARIVTAAAGAQILVELLKTISQHPRPTVVPHLVEATSYSFTSGHALVAAATYCTLAAIACHYVTDQRARKAIRIICWTIAGLVGFSRVYLGVHYPSDVFGGGVVGIAWFYFCAYLWRKRSEAHPS